MERGPRIYPGAYYFDRSLLREEKLHFLNNNQLRLLRNLIYAIHGHSFKSQDLQDYFGKQTWYKQEPSFSDSVFTVIEKENILLIKTIEQSRRN